MLEKMPEVKGDRPGKPKACRLPDDAVQKRQKEKELTLERQAPNVRRYPPKLASRSKEFMQR